MASLLGVEQKYVDRLWSKVIKGGPADCWEWTGSLDSYGYGQIGIKDIGLVLVHRLAWVTENDQEIPDGMVVRHTCDNRSCCNPHHLRIGTQAENVQDAVERGRAKGARGTSNDSAVLTEDDVIEIRKLLKSGLSQTEVAGKYGVVSQTINNIATGYSWGWLEGDDGQLYFG